MRKVFINCATRRTARRRAPWAAVIVKAEYGYWAFECVQDAETWIGQR